MNHSILLRKLKMYGFDNSSVLWFNNYLSDRSQITQVNGMKSGSVLIDTGTFQGTPLGPLLFIIYVNDIENIMGENVCNMYADDTAIVCKGGSFDEAMESSQTILYKVVKWCDLNRITLNSKKIKHMGFAPKQNCIYTKGVSMKINDSSIVDVDKYKYLGVKIDDMLKFEDQIEDIISKVNSRLMTFDKTRKFMDDRTSAIIYKQTIMQLLDYSWVVIDSSTQSLIKRLQPLQNRAIKTITRHNGYVSTEDMDALHSDLHLMKLNVRRKMFMSVYMYKLSQNHDALNVNRPDRILHNRDKIKLKIAFSNKDRVKKSPFYLCNNIWKKLSIESQRCDNIFEFKKHLRKSNLSYMDVYG